MAMMASLWSAFMWPAIIGVKAATGSGAASAYFSAAEPPHIACESRHPAGEFTDARAEKISTRKVRNRTNQRGR
eukprot:454127-Prorocentrum_minimum.AAC.1